MCPVSNKVQFVCLENGVFGEGVVFAFNGWMLMLRFVSGSLYCWVLINIFFILFHANK